MTGPSVDPLLLDRYVDGECSPDEASAFETAVAADLDLAARLASRQAFLAGVRTQGMVWRAGLAEQMPTHIEARVRDGLRSTRRVTRLGWTRWAAAAVLLLGVGLAALWIDTDEATAIPQQVLDAAALARLEAEDGDSATCTADAATSPYAFPPVQEGELQVASCESEQDGETHARLYRPEDLPVVGYVAVPEPGTRPSQTVGKTDLGDVIVYDVMFGRSRAYLAVKRELVDLHGDCAACHNRSRDGQKNPHYIELRRWR